MLPTEGPERRFHCRGHQNSLAAAGLGLQAAEAAAGQDGGLAGSALLLKVLQRPGEAWGERGRGAAGGPGGWAGPAQPLARGLWSPSCAPPPLAAVRTPLARQVAQSK